MAGIPLANKNTQIREVKMKISTKGRYAIKLMLDLATYYNGEPVKIKDIARRQDADFAECIECAKHMI